MPFPCPTCRLMSEDYRIALEESDNAGHKDEAGLLLDYAETVGRALYQHINTHVTPPSPSELAQDGPTVDGGTNES